MLTRSLSLVLLCLFTMAGCGGSNSTPSTPTNEQPAAQLNDLPSETTTPSQPGTTEAGTKLIDEIFYTRPYDYPHMVSLAPQFVATSSGKKVSVRVTFPANEKGVPAQGPFPVILTQSGYNTNLLSMLFMNSPGNLLLGSPDYFMVQRGYVQVAVDALGTGASEGGWELFSPEEQTAFADMVDWVHAQPWSNGQLGVAGVSYMAISSLFAAQRRPDDIDAVFASLPLGDAMRGIAGTGGLINGHFMSTWMQITAMLSTQHVPSALAYPQHMNHYMKVTQEHAQHIDDYFIPLIEDSLNGEPNIAYDGEFWSSRSPLTNIQKIKAPTFIFGALNDLFQRDEPLLFEALQNNNVDSRLVIYNGSHFPNFVTSHIGNNAVPPIDYLLLQWFDKHLRGLNTGTENIPAVIQHVKNYPTPSTPSQFKGDSFATTTTWPHPQAKAERWYLRGNNTLDQQAPENTETSHLMSTPEFAQVSAWRNEAMLAFEVHINDGTDCSRSYEQWILGLALPKSCYSNTEKSIQQRVIFESETMVEDYYINGPIQADIWIESTSADAVLAVQIEEVSPKQSMPITNGLLLASARAVDESRSRFMDGQMIQPYHYLTQEKAAPLTPGEVVKLQVEIFPTSAIIRKGNKLRVSISPSNQAQGLLNYQQQDQMAGSITTIHISDEYPSSVVLPIVPTSALN